MKYTFRDILVTLSHDGPLVVEAENQEEAEDEVANILGKIGTISAVDADIREDDCSSDSE